VSGPSGEVGRPGGSGDPGAEATDTDVVAVSVAAYTPVAAAYRRTHRDRMADRVERFAGLLPVPSLVLDAGCGPGRDMARFASLGHVVRGIDANPAFVAMAAVHAPTVLGDLRGLGTTYPDGIFDGVWACASLVHLPRPEACGVLAQIAALLRPVGRFYACVPVGPEGYRDEPDGRRWYAGWDARAFAETVAAAGFAVDDVQEGAFVEVWATRLP
jgi:SAM-dependent methyltransferase